MPCKPLAAHRCLGHANFGRSEWRFTHAQAGVQAVSVPTRFTANDAVVLMAAAQAGAGIALALQGVLGNIVAGLTIIFTQPFHVGDYISIGDEEGEVLDISLFNTTLGHTDRSRVVIPSRKIVGEILHNCGQIRRLPLLANVAYGTDIATALALVNEVLAGNERVLKTPAPVVGVARLTDACVSININPWVNVPDYEAAISEINQAVLAAFRAHGIVIPLPQREVRML